MSAKRVLEGRYEVGDLLGHGGMADVYSGRDLRLGRRVAIKVLRRDLAQDPLFRARFRREAQTMVGLCHSAIVCIFDTGYEEVGEDSAGTVRVPFIVMEHVDGWSLRELVRRGGLTLERSVRYQLGVLSALEFSHRAGVVHCDIKPANVMVSSEGAVKLVDFGISRARGDLATTVAQAYEVLGTPAYISPEQARGEAADVCSDLYSAGCLLYELLTGRPPFAGDPLSVAYQHVHDEPVPVRTGFAGVDAVLVKALAKSPTDRFQSARAFRQALQSAAKDSVHPEGIGAHPGALETDLPAAPVPGRHAGMAVADC
ncbi:protein kinase domain-containing protein [Nocardioides marmotae]|uniref:protein kinase domain-containing protein n=1 Tax=Nocardioides marmotae TaxID=2663857 RepID=UPI0012B5FBAC|nr:protein kinase [Nocardioides marmotae]MBC9734964.1 serine/threonine protein kinase [Nocardioides marmotae]MTB86064.1 protein kinase [Nocardioides marmotae]